jgi:hypothetical protein
MPNVSSICAAAFEPQYRALLPYRHGREKNRHDPVLTEGNAELRMARHLESEPPVSPLIQQLSFGETPNR